MLVYKVCKKMPDPDRPGKYRYFSCTYNPSHGLEYTIGKETIPTLIGSRIFVFNSLKCACDFMGGPSERHAILECEANNPIRVLSICGNAEDDPEFWTNKDYQHTFGGVPPKGTLCATAVKPIRIVR